MLILVLMSNICICIYKSGRYKQKDLGHDEASCICLYFPLCIFQFEEASGADAGPVKDTLVAFG